MYESTWTKSAKNLQSVDKHQHEERRFGSFLDLHLMLSRGVVSMGSVPWVPRNPQIFEKYEMEPTDVEGTRRV